MFEFIKAGGWLMIPILLCSVVAMAIIIERFFALRVKKVIPLEDIERARKMAATGKVTDAMIEALSNSSLVGRVLSTGLENHSAPRHIMKENIEEAGRHAVHRMERYLPALGTIAAVSPLMGLLGTVFGMINVFGAINRAGVGNPTELAGGISQALITTAAGISVAIIALIFHRYFKARVDNYVVSMEQEAIRLIEITNNNRRLNTPSASMPNTSVSEAENGISHANNAAASALKAARARAAQLRGAGV